MEVQEGGGVSFLSMSPSDGATDSGEGMDQEKKIRREIANSNERRRMQSINAGFQSLRTLLPHHEGEKLSKAAILQQTAEYIYSLEQEKTRLLAQNCHLKRLLSLSQQHLDNNQDGTTNSSSATEAKRKRAKADLKECGSPVETIVIGSTIVEREEIAEEEEEGQHEVILGNTVVTLETTEEVEEQEDEEDRKFMTVEVKEEEAFMKASSSSSPSETCRIYVAAAAAEGAIGSDTLVVPIQNNTETIRKGGEEQHINTVEEVAGGRSYIVTSTSKQNLDSIVEAIKHLEGDHLFSEEGRVPHEVVQEEIVEYSLSDGNKTTVSVQQKDNSIIIFKNCN